MDIHFTSSPFHQDRTKFHAKFISVPATDPLLTSCVVFPACRNSCLRDKGERRQTFTFNFFRSLGYGLE